MMTRLYLLLTWLVAAPVVAGPPEGERLDIGVDLSSLRDVSRADIDATLHVWADELSRTLDLPSTVRFYASVQDMRPDFDAGRIDFVIADPIDLLTHLDESELADGFGGGDGGEGALLLIARKSEGIKGFGDLSGKRVVTLGKNGISDLVLSTSCLRQFHLTCERAGLSVEKVMRTQQLVLQVFFGRADAALMRAHTYDVAVELNPQIRDHLSVIQRIPVYPGAIGLFTARVSPSFREYVIDKVPLIEKNPRGQQILQVLQTDHLVHFPKAILGPIRGLMDERRKLESRYGI